MAHRGWGRLAGRFSVTLAFRSIQRPQLRCGYHSEAVPASSFMVARKKIADFQREALAEARIAARAAEEASEAVRKSIAESWKPVARRIENLDAGYKEAVALRVEAFCRRNRLLLLAALGSGMSIVLWKVTISISELLVGLSKFSFQFGLLALTSTSVVCMGLAFRTRHTINPDAVYRIVMNKLQTSAGFMEVMGRPVVGGNIRAYFTSGGGLKIDNLKPSLSCNRCFIVFPVQGYERRAIVSSEVIKQGGKYHVKLLAADIPTDESDERLYVVGDELGFTSSGGPYVELQDPVFKAIAAEPEFNLLDEIEANLIRKQLAEKVAVAIAKLRKLVKVTLKSSRR